MPAPLGLRRKPGQPISKEWLLSRITVTSDGCWKWKFRLDHRGYAKGRTNLMHRESYRLWKGEIPSGLQLDHLCRNRACINPEHLEAVTGTENQLRGNSFSGLNARKTHCKNGHEFTPENTYHPLRFPSRRVCRTCHGRKTKAERGQ